MIGPNETTLGGYNLRQLALAFPAERLPGSLFGLDWASGDFAVNMLAMPLPENAADPAPLLWTPALNADPLPPDGRFGIVKLEDVTVPHPYLVDLADKSFNELRKFTALQSGWDFLSSLENAYLPLSEPPTLCRPAKLALHRTRLRLQSCSPQRRLHLPRQRTDQRSDLLARLPENPLSGWLPGYAPHQLHLGYQRPLQ